MIRVLDVFKIGDVLSVTLEGRCDKIKNGSVLTDDAGNHYNVVSVAMPEHGDPSDFSKSTTVLITPCTLQKGRLVSVVS